MWELIFERCKTYSDVVQHVVGFHHLEIFGMYFVLDTSKEGQKYSVLTAEQATEYMKIKDVENLRTLGCQLLINVSNVLKYCRKFGESCQSLNTVSYNVKGRL